MLGVAATSTLPIERELFSPRTGSWTPPAADCWLCVRERVEPAAVAASSAAFCFARAFPNFVVIVTSYTAARLRSPFGPILSERDRSRLSCSSESDKEFERSRVRRSASLPLLFVFADDLVDGTDVDADADVDAEDFRRFDAGLGETGGERPSESVSELPGSGKSFERKREQRSGSFALNL